MLAAKEQLPTAYEISLDAAGDALKISLSRPDCATEWQFPDSYPGMRSEFWEVADTSLQWSNQTIRRTDGRCFRRFTFVVHPDTLAADRTYPFLTMAYPGALIYLPHLIPLGVAGAALKVTGRLRAPWCREIRMRREVCQFSSNIVWPTRQSGGYLEIGFPPDDPLDIVRMRRSSSVPYWIQQRAHGLVGSMVQETAKRLGPLPTGVTSLYLLFDRDFNHLSWRGWTSGNTLVLKFSGANWTDSSPTNSAILYEFALHETLHLWNAWAYTPSDDTPAWLTEGFAEYLSRRSSIEWSPNAASLFALQARINLNACLKALEPDRNTSSSEVRLVGRGLYECGFTVQWLWDRALARSPRRADIWDLWREVFQSTSNGTYSLESVLQTAQRLAPDGAFRDDITWLTSDDPYTMLQERLRHIGIVVAADTESTSYLDALRGAAIQHLLGQHCRGRHGFTSFESSIVLDTDDRCDIANGNPRIVSLQGRGLFALELRDGVQEMQTRCAKSESVTLGTDQGEHIEVPCRMPFVLPTPALAVNCPDRADECLTVGIRIQTPVVR